jgi:hypothetical protein
VPTSYQLFAVESFPRDRSLVVGVQLNLLANNDHNVEESQTKVVPTRDVETHLFEEYRVEHDFLVHLEYPGRARGQSFREYVTPYKFPLFLSQEAEEPFPFALVRTKKKVAHDFVRRMNSEEPSFDLTATAVDFEVLRPRLAFVKGAWFGAIQAANLHTTGLFGEHVDQSDEFRHAESVGELRNLLVEVVDEGDLAHSVMFTADGGIVLYKAYMTVEDELAVVRSVIRDLLAGCIGRRER